MKRLFATTALAATIATASVAATEGQLNEIQTYLPNADVELLTDEQVTMLITIANGGENRGDKIERMEAVIEGTPAEGDYEPVASVDVDTIEAPAPLTDAEYAELKVYDPDFTGAGYTEAELESLAAALAAGDREKIESLLLAAK
ncbi:hypothetical protein [Pseudoponticoccus marisrubri]|uniref:Uncharacterized protein n=1 Tax=Pseudoponticoccus marisrubri TaxID=1685382 RepID=A0A0W7WPP2_9RHOB|nr:hypothetical protein [Pseudoponticoccus marisrubri]KUF12554.1 hypothetical protein AVJ23_02165 [Pseudoponticoccus marisrubri]